MHQEGALLRRQVGTQARYALATLHRQGLLRGLALQAAESPLGQVPRWQVLLGHPLQVGQLRLLHLP